VLKQGFRNVSPSIIHRRLALAALVTGMVSGVANSAHACSCAPPPTPATFVERTSVIFEGIPTKIELFHSRGLPQGFDWQRATVRSTIRVVKIYKGTLSMEITIKSRLGSALCGWQPHGVGKRQIFAVNRSAGGYTTNLCAMYPLSGRPQNNPYLKFIRALKPTKPK
jgi:hypothetical protein